jgi:hypothetical protein
MQVRGARGEFRHRVEKRHVGTRAARIVKLPGTVLRRELLRHAPDRRDADAAGDEDDVLGILDEREIVARRADLDRVPDAHLVEDVARAAAALRIALDADDIAFGIVGGVEQGELADEPVGDVNVDMRSRLVSGQGAAARPGKGVQIGIAGDDRYVGQRDVDQSPRAARLGRCRYACGWCRYCIHAGIDRRLGQGSATCSFRVCCTPNSGFRRVLADTRTPRLFHCPQLRVVVRVLTPDPKTGGRPPDDFRRAPLS